MKFPKSMHAEGWLSHIEPRELGHMPKGMKNDDTAAPKAIKAPKADTRVRPDTPIGGSEVVSEVRTPAPARRSTASPWLIGAGAGVALIGLAVSMSHNLSSVESPAAPPPTVAAKEPAQPAPAPVPTPEDSQLAHAPTAAGPQATPAAEAKPEAAVPKLAVAPVEPAPKTQAPQPVAKTLTPKAEAPVAQVAPPAPLRSEPAAKPTTTPEAATTPPAAQPQPQQPTQADPEDAGITVKVRAALAADAVLASVPIAVSTDHGIVKLEGQAPDAQAREHATAVVASTAGVKGVDNRLTLPPVAQVQLEPRQGS